MRTAVCSEIIPQGAKEALLREGYGVITLPPHPALAKPVATHADMIFLILDSRIFFDKIYYEAYPETVRKIVSTGGFSLTLTDPLSAEYPGDVALNVLVGKRFAAGHETCASVVRDAVKASGRAFVPVKQGYASCSCASAAGCVVTADEGISRALDPYCDTLRIRPGSVALAPYDTGFIGGASGADGGKCFFVGDMTRHLDGDAIKDFFGRHGVECISLTGGALCDIGGIKFI